MLAWLLAGCADFDVTGEAGAEAGELGAGCGRPQATNSAALTAQPINRVRARD